MRPTADRVRQSLMDILRPWIEGRLWLDLYAGCGAVGIEALSRGAAGAVFVERCPQACRAIHHNLQLTGLAARAEVCCEAAEAAVARLLREGRRFDVVFADPPYGDTPHGEPGVTARLVELVGPGGLVVWQHPCKAPSPALPGMAGVRQCRYGETCLSFFARREEGSPWP